MGRDVTAFRERFKAYKNGKSVSEIYDAGLPKYAGGYTPSPEFVDRTIREEGFLSTPKNIGDGLMTIGSGLTRLKWLDQYSKAGVWTKEMNRAAVAEELANADKYLRTVFPEYDSYPEGVREVLLDIQYNTGKVNMKYSPKFVTAVRNKNWGEARRQMNWGNTDPKFGKGLRARNARRQALWDKALGYDARPAIQQPVSTAVRPIIKEELVVPVYDPTISPYISGKPMVKLRPRVQLPNIIEVMEDSEWEPGFPGLKNGKLPGYKIGHNVSNAKLNEDGTFTDDYTKVFEDMYVTPQKTDLKRGSYTLNNFPYYLQHRTDWMKPFMSSGTNEKGLELVHPEFDLLLGGRLIATDFLNSKVLIKPKSNNKHLLDSVVDDKWIPVPEDKTGMDAISKAMMPSKRPYTDEGEAAIKSLIDFYTSPQYKIRALTSKNTDPEYDINIFNNMKKMFIDNINSAKYADDMPYIIRRDFNSPTGWVYNKTAAGQNTPDTNLIQITRNDWADLYETYLHELIHQSNNRANGKIVEGYNLPLIAKSLTKSKYLDIPDELRARVLTGLVDMMKKGLDINDIRAILSYLGNNLEELPGGVQQLIDNFDYNDVLKLFLYMLSAGPIGFGIYNKNRTNGIPQYKNGKSPIHIKPANRGKFTALKKRTGHSASWFKENGTPAQKKMAVFALNAKKWKH